MIARYIHDQNVSLINKVKVIEVLCKITMRFGELLPYYIDKYDIMNTLCHICSSRSKVEDYCRIVEIEQEQLHHDWNVLRASCLSNINDIILTLGRYSNKYILNIIDIALGILQHEHETGGVLMRTSLYVLNTILFLNKVCVGYSGNMKNKLVLFEKIQHIKIVLENLLVNGHYSGRSVHHDAVCKYHIQNCLDLYL